MAAMRRLALLSLLFAFTASAEMSFEPLDPTTADAVFLHVAERWSDGCLPMNPVVTRSGNRVEVLWRIREGGCPLMETDWLDRAPLGMFEAGVYEVVPKVDMLRGRFRTFPALTLIVRDRLPFAMTPMYVSTRGGEVTFSGEPFCSGSVRIDNMDFPYRRGGCAIVVTVPPHPAGRADISVRSADSSSMQTYRAVLRFVDPDAAPDPAIVERILVPILYDGPGAFGSRWVTEATIMNRDWFTRPFQWYPFRPCSGAQCGTAVPWLETVSLSSMFGQRPQGLLLFVDRNDSAKRIHFSSIIRNVNNEGSFGTEVPIVRENDFLTVDALMPNVTWGPNARAMLRIYGVDGVLEHFYVDVQAKGKAPESIQFERLPSPCAAVPCNSDQPAFAAIDLAAAFPRYFAANPGRIDVAVRTNDASNIRRFWAFVTVTHNATQNVTVITPQ
jgi:hypothetical protein